MGPCHLDLEKCCCLMAYGWFCLVEADCAPLSQGCTCLKTVLSDLWTVQNIDVMGIQNS